MEVKVINYQIKHDKELSEKEKDQLLAEVQRENAQLKQENDKRDKQFADQIKEDRRQIEIERERSRKSKEEHERYKFMMTEERNKKKRELIKAQQESVEKTQKVIEDLKNENNRLRRTKPIKKPGCCVS